MIDININDPQLIENVKAIMELKKSGIFTDEQIQELYNEQVERDCKECERKTGEKNKWLV